MRNTPTTILFIMALLVSTMSSADPGPTPTDSDSVTSPTLLSALSALSTPSLRRFGFYGSANTTPRPMDSETSYTSLNLFSATRGLSGQAYRLSGNFSSVAQSGLSTHSFTSNRTVGSYGGTDVMFRSGVTKESLDKSLSQPENISVEMQSPPYQGRQLESNYENVHSMAPKREVKTEAKKVKPLPRTSNWQTLYLPLAVVLAVVIWVSFRKGGKLRKRLLRKR